MDTWTDLGVGGIFLLLVLRMALEFAARVRRRNGHMTAGEQPTAFWAERFDRIERAIDTSSARLERALERLFDRSS